VLIFVILDDFVSSHRHICNINLWHFVRVFAK